ncbi:MAG: cysteine synthase family protein, partial [Deltaproteobacteria bacterium]|nr:cysteine synthase family protein [Deltaproteobacteria bacterium]
MTTLPHLLSSAIEAIGNTPLVDLSRLCRQIDGRILAKLEYFNPGYSKKDRIARQIIADAETSGKLMPGQTVVELTSGNTGTGLAIVCGIKGYPFVAVMSKGNSVERARMMSALGTEVVLVDQLPQSVPGQVSGGDLELVEERTRKIVIERAAFRADQFRLNGNFRAHYLNTGPEIIRQSGGDIDLFCDFAGTGGSFAGCAAALKEHNPEIKSFIVEPDGAASLAGEPVTYPNHRIQGGGYGMADLPLLDCGLIDGYLKVSDQQAI